MKSQPSESPAGSPQSEADRGLQLVELGTLDAVATLPNARVIAVALYQWVAETLNEERREELEGVTLEVVRITYLGSYVGLGLRYPEHEIVGRTSSALSETGARNRGPLVESFGDTLVRERLGEFLLYLARRPHVNWDKRTCELFEGEHDVAQ